MDEEMTKSTIQIPSCPDYFITRGGDVYNKKGKKLSPYINNGYRFIGLYNNKRERKNFCIHRLVYEAWGGKLKAGLWVNHKDGDKANNHIDNLELITPSENHAHAFRTGLQCNKGEQHPRSKLKEKDILRIREMRTHGLSHRKIAEEFNVTQATISYVLAGKMWIHV